MFASCRLIFYTISSQARCSASLRGMPSSPRILQLVVVARHTAPRLRAQHPLPQNVSRNALCSIARVHVLRTYVFFWCRLPSLTSCLRVVVLPRRQAARAYRARRGWTPSRLDFDSIWGRENVGNERGRWICRGVVSELRKSRVAKLPARRDAAVPSSGHFHTSRMLRKAKRHRHPTVHGLL